MVAAVLRLSAPERATRSSFRLYDERGSTKNELLEMKGKKSERTGESPCLNLQLDPCRTQCLLCGLFGLHLSGLLCTLRLFKLRGILLIFNCRVGNIAGAGLDRSTGCALLVVQVSLGCCRCSCHDGAMGIAGRVVRLRFCNLHRHQVDHHF
jgi:hypothetical protein